MRSQRWDRAPAMPPYPSVLPVAAHGRGPSPSPVLPEQNRTRHLRTSRCSDSRQSLIFAPPLPSDPSQPQSKVLLNDLLQVLYEPPHSTCVHVKFRESLSDSGLLLPPGRVLSIVLQCSVLLTVDKHSECYSHPVAVDCSPTPAAARQLADEPMQESAAVHSDRVCLCLSVSLVWRAL